MILGIEALDWHIRTNLRRAEALQETIEQLMADRDEALTLVDHYTKERNRFLGQAGLENVVAIQTNNNLGDTA